VGASESGAGDHGDRGAEAVAPKRVRIDLGGTGFGNGAFIETTGDTAVVFVTGIDTAEDMVKIFAAVRRTGATKGTLFTGPVTSPTDLIRYQRLAEAGGLRFGGKVSKIGEDSFRLDFDNWPVFD
jgi:hypothetical protein